MTPPGPPAVDSPFTYRQLPPATAAAAAAAATASADAAAPVTPARAGAGAAAGTEVGPDRDPYDSGDARTPSRGNQGPVTPLSGLMGYGAFARAAPSPSRARPIALGGYGAFAFTPGLTVSSPLSGARFRSVGRANHRPQRATPASKRRSDMPPRFPVESPSFAPTPDHHGPATASPAAPRDRRGADAVGLPPAPFPATPAREDGRARGQGGAEDAHSLRFRGAVSPTGLIGLMTPALATPAEPAAPWTGMDAADGTAGRSGGTGWRGASDGGRAAAAEAPSPDWGSPVGAAPGWPAQRAGVAEPRGSGGAGGVPRVGAATASPDHRARGARPPEQPAAERSPSPASRPERRSVAIGSAGRSSGASGGEAGRGVGPAASLVAARRALGLAYAAADVADARAGGTLGPRSAQRPPQPARSRLSVASENGGFAGGEPGQPEGTSGSPAFSAGASPANVGRQDRSMRAAAALSFQHGPSLRGAGQPARASEHTRSAVGSVRGRSRSRITTSVDGSPTRSDAGMADLARSLRFDADEEEQEQEQAAEAAAGAAAAGSRRGHSRRAEQPVAGQFLPGAASGGTQSGHAAATPNGRPTPDELLPAPTPSAPGRASSKSDSPPGVPASRGATGPSLDLSRPVPPAATASGRSALRGGGALDRDGGASVAHGADSTDGGPRGMAGRAQPRAVQTLAGGALSTSPGSAPVTPARGPGCAAPRLGERHAPIGADSRPSSSPSSRFESRREVSASLHVSGDEALFDRTAVTQASFGRGEPGHATTPASAGPHTGRSARWSPALAGEQSLFSEPPSPSHLLGRPNDSALQRGHEHPGPLHGGSDDPLIGPRSQPAASPWSPGARTEAAWSAPAAATSPRSAGSPLTPTLPASAAGGPLAAGFQGRLVAQAQAARREALRRRQALESREVFALTALDATSPVPVAVLSHSGASMWTLSRLEAAESPSLEAAAEAGRLSGRPWASAGAAAWRLGPSVSADGAELSSLQREVSRGAALRELAGMRLASPDVGPGFMAALSPAEGPRLGAEESGQAFAWRAAAAASPQPAPPSSAWAPPPRSSGVRAPRASQPSGHWQPAQERRWTPSSPPPRRSASRTVSVATPARVSRGSGASGPFYRSPSAATAQLPPPSAARLRQSLGL